MGEKERFFDIWIVESGTGYRQVPYSVVTDWLQEGRLLAEDKVCVSGTNKFVQLGSVPAFAAYRPKAQPHRVEDKAEALEPVQAGFAWKRRKGDEEEDVDMIPLIDISLVLLIFFMMTASAVTTGASSIETPDARFKGMVASANMLWIGIDRDPDGQPRYSIGKGEKSPGEILATREQLLEAFASQLQNEPEETIVRIRAHRHLPYEVVRGMVSELERFKKPRGKLTEILAEVSEKQTK
jgi:biopolymer transport protein ExbD